MSVVDRLLAFIGVKLKGSTQKKLLWTNPNPNTPVSTLEVNVDLSAYEEIMVIGNCGQGMQTRMIPSVITKVGKGGCMLMYGDSHRLFITSTNKVYFDSATHANRCIPCYIYGIKTVGGGYRLTRLICRFFKRRGGVCHG